VRVAAYPQPLPERRGVETPISTPIFAEDHCEDSKSFPLGEDLGEASSHHYEITIRLVCDNYVIQTTSMEHVQTKITSTASATTSYHVQFLPAQTAISAKIQRGYLG
jgi:hypothetical protein